MEKFCFPLVSLLDVFGTDDEVRTAAGIPEYMEFRTVRKNGWIQVHVNREQWVSYQKRRTRGRTVGKILILSFVVLVGACIVALFG